MPVPIIVSDAGGATIGDSLATIRGRLAETLGHHGVGTVTTLAAGLEADKRLISTAYQSDQLPPESLDGLFVHIRDGAEARSSRRIVNGSFDGPLGALVVDRPYAAPLAEATVFEVSVLPGEKYQGIEGLRPIINLALEELPVIDLVSITITSTGGVADTQYSLASYAWPIKAVGRVFYPRTSTTSERRREIPRGQWELVLNAHEPILSFTSLPASVGQAVEVELHRPADTWIKTGGTWGSSTTGLVLDADQCLYDAATVVRQARPIALQRLALVHERGSKARERLEEEAAEARVTAALSRLYGRYRGNGAQRIGAIGGR